MVAKKGYKHPGHRHAVVAVNPDGEVAGYFAQIKDVVTTYGIDRHSITYCCRRQYGRRTALGFMWYYEEDFKRLWEKHGPELLKWTPDPNRDRITGHLLKGNKVGKGCSHRTAEGLRRVAEATRRAHAEGRIPYSGRPIRCLNDGKDFSRCTDAADYYGIKASLIRACAHPLKGGYAITVDGDTIPFYGGTITIGTKYTRNIQDIKIK